MNKVETVKKIWMLLMVGSMVACTGGKEHHAHDQKENVDAR